ncbi:MAG: KH domain-containing protein [Abditibacteriota bacterium]|nr:KH domain-containing protein [Abditibacteriota bacterium]MBR4749766.1 KH domain-containing protein [Abditibacteriota bacterium]
MKELIRYIVTSLVEYPEQVEIKDVFENNETVYYVSVDDRDLGKVIGKGGRIADSIRAIVKAAAVKQKENVFVKIVSG